jgi:hypothetical protein
MIGLPAMVILAAGGQLLLKIFGANYAHQATIPLLLLILTYIPGLPKVQYIAVCRATHRIGRATIVLSLGAICEASAVVVGGKMGGLDGVAVGYLIMQVIEGLVTAPTVFRAASSKHRAAITVTAAQPVIERSYFDRQQMGLAALIALASAAVTDGHSLDAATAVWRTGGFPVVTGFSPAVTAANPVLLEDDAGSYGMRQQAGINALLAIATPVAPDGGRRANIDVLLAMATPIDPERTFETPTPRRRR